MEEFDNHVNRPEVEDDEYVLGPECACAPTAPDEATVNVSRARVVLAARRRVCHRLRRNQDWSWSSEKVADVRRATFRGRSPSLFVLKNLSALSCRKDFRRADHQSVLRTPPSLASKASMGGIYGTGEGRKCFRGLFAATPSIELHARCLLTS